MFLQNAVACQQGHMNPPQMARCTFDVRVEDELLILGGIWMRNSVLLVSLHLSWTHALQPQDAQIQFNKLVNEFTSMQTLSVFHVHLSKPSGEGLVTKLPQVCSRPYAKRADMSSLSGLNVLLQAH